MLYGIASRGQNQKILAFDSPSKVKKSVSFLILICSKGDAFSLYTRFRFFRLLR